MMPHHDNRITKHHVMPDFRCHSKTVVIYLPVRVMGDFLSVDLLVN